MIKVLFICHGNICRSTMAQYMFEYEIEKRGIVSLYEVDSAATSREEIGNPIYPPARAKLMEKGVPVGTHRARQFTVGDYESADVVFVMDQNNMRNILRIVGQDTEGKIRMLLEERAISDPWYTGDFEATFRDVKEGIERFLG